MPTCVSSVHFRPIENSRERFGVFKASYTKLFFIAIFCAKEWVQKNKKKRKIHFLITSFFFGAKIIQYKIPEIPKKRHKITNNRLKHKFQA
jgi:hypothetical protein